MTIGLDDEDSGEWRRAKLHCDLPCLKGSARVDGNHRNKKRVDIFHTSFRQVVLGRFRAFALETSAP